MRFAVSIVRFDGIRMAALISNAEPAIGLPAAWLVSGETLVPLGMLSAVLACSGIIDCDGSARITRWISMTAVLYSGCELAASD